MNIGMSLSSVASQPWNVLVFPAASEIGLEIFRALRDCKEVILHAANLPGSNLASFYYKKIHSLPSIHHPDFDDALKQLVTELNIDAIFPAHDDVVATLGQHAAKLQIPVITSPAETCRICRSKRLTYELLANTVPVPKIFAPTDDDTVWPRFVKPDCGQGSERARRIYEASTLHTALAQEPDLLVLEDLPGTEYTVDCFSHQKQGLLYAQARERTQIKSGIAVQTHPVALPEAWDYATRISQKLVFHGAWFFQLKATAQGELKLLEVAPRIAGSMALSHALGVNLPLLSLYSAMGYTVSVTILTSPEIKFGRSLDAKFIDDRTIEALYIDYDDTLVVHHRINIRLIALIFNCRNRGIPVILITRHAGELQDSLANNRLTPLFDKIIHITDSSVPKSNFIKEKNAVLIDDSFRERWETAQNCGIRCYDSAIAICLLDERI